MHAAVGWDWLRMCGIAVHAPGAAPKNQPLNRTSTGAGLRDSRALRSRNAFCSALSWAVAMATVRGRCRRRGCGRQTVSGGGRLLGQRRHGRPQDCARPPLCRRDQASNCLTTVMRCLPPALGRCTRGCPRPLLYPAPARRLDAPLAHCRTARAHLLLLGHPGGGRAAEGHACAQGLHRYAWLARSARVAASKPYGAQKEWSGDRGGAARADEGAGQKSPTHVAQHTQHLLARHRALPRAYPILEGIQPPGPPPLHSSPPADVSECTGLHAGHEPNRAASPAVKTARPSPGASGGGGATCAHAMAASAALASDAVLSWLKLLYSRCGACMPEQ